MPEWLLAIVIGFAILGGVCACYGLALAIEEVGDARRKLDYLDESDDRHSDRIRDLTMMVREIEARLDGMQSDGDA